MQQVSITTAHVTLLHVTQIALLNILKKPLEYTELQKNQYS